MPPAEGANLKKKEAAAKDGGEREKRRNLTGFFLSLLVRTEADDAEVTVAAAIHDALSLSLSGAASLPQAPRALWEGKTAKASKGTR